MIKRYSLLKLTNGETLICNLIGETDRHVCVEDPLKLELTTSDDSYTMVTTYWIPLPDEELRVDIRQEHVVVISDVTQDMQDFYLEAVAHARGRKWSTENEVDEVNDLEQRLIQLHNLMLMAAKSANTDLTFH